MNNLAPPHDHTAEQAVLGAMLVSGSTVEDVAGLLRASDFYQPAHEFVFNALVDLRARNVPADAITVADELAKRGQLDKVGGMPFLAELVSAAAISGNATYHARVIREKSTLRRLAAASLKIRQDATEGHGAADVILSRSQKLLDEIQPPTQQQAGASVADMWPEVIELVDKGGTRGPALPWVDLDQYLGGLVPGKLYVVGARPGVGKSMFGQSLAAHWADRHTKNVYLASFEMQAREVSMRLLSAKSAVQYSKMRAGECTEDEWAKISRASQWEAARRIVINDDTSSTMATIRAGARELARRGELGLVIIDYAGLVTPRDPKLPRQEQVAEVSRDAKRLAMDLNVPVVLLSQLNREVASRGGGQGTATPTLTDLRDSGALEQDADAVLLLHLPWDEQLGAMSEWDLHVIVAKNRDGQLGTVNLVRQGFIMRIVMRDLASRYHRN